MSVGVVKIVFSLSVSRRQAPRSLDEIGLKTMTTRGLETAQRSSAGHILTTTHLFKPEDDTEKDN